MTDGDWLFVLAGFWMGVGSQLFADACWNAWVKKS
jgi:hypothetical protein